MRGGDDLRAADRAHVFHPYTSIAEQRGRDAPILHGGRGVWLTDTDGHDVIDAMAGLWCVAVGYGRDEIADAMADQAKQLGYGHVFLAQSNEPGIELARRLARWTPDGLDHFFFCNSGSEANDTAVKLVWLLQNLRGKPEKKKIISREGAYHGVTLAATSLSGLPNMHALFDAPLDRFLHTTKAHFGSQGLAGETDAEFAQRCACELDALIEREGPDTVAAFWGEPVMGAGGVLTPPDGYWKAVQEVCRRHDVLVVADEVITGFGRLGKPFASQHYGIAPDLMIVAKAIASGYFPVSAAIVSNAIYEELAAASPRQGPVAHGHTTSMHPVGAAAALANLDILEREGLLVRAAEVGPDFQEKLRAALKGHPNIGEVRGDGLIAAASLVSGDGSGGPLPAEWKSGLSLQRALFDEGLVSRALGDSMALCPPLVIADDEVDEVMVRLRRGLDRWSAQTLPKLGGG